MSLVADKVHCMAWRCMCMSTLVALAHQNADPVMCSFFYTCCQHVGDAS
jgi:hypothetical protein